MSTLNPPFSHTLVVQAQQDAERYAEYAARLVKPYIPLLTHVAETQRRMTVAYAPALESMVKIQRAIESALEPYRRMQELRASFVKEVCLPSEKAWVVTPVRQDIEIIGPLSTAAVELPEKTLWEELELRFKDSHTLSIFYKGKRVQDCDYAELGFARENTRDKKPSKPWGLLVQLSIISEHSRVMKPTTENLSRTLNISKAALQKNKEILAKKLQLSLGLFDDPFRRYDAEVGYQTKFKLVPESLLRGSGDLHPSGGRYFDEIVGEGLEEY
jgi:hypothetical protein